jgi:integrase
MACIRKRRGKWVVDYRDGAGIRKWITCETKTEAEDALAKAIPESRQPRQAPAVDANITVQGYAVHWLMTVAASTKPLTAESYRVMVTHHIIPRLGQVKVRALSKAMVRQFLADVLTAGRLARSSLRTCHGVLRTMLNAAKDDGLILTNPAEDLARSFRLVESPRQRQERIKAMTREQIEALLQAADPRYWPLFLLLARAGMRLGEALGLQWDDLDLSDRTARIETWSGDRIGTPKSGAARTVHLSRQTCEALRRLRLERKAETLRRGWPEVPAWVFCTRNGNNPLEVDNVRCAFRRALKAARLPGHFTPHSLRHSFASILISEGVSLAYVQRQLGHASIKMTVDTYGKWLPMSDKAAVDSLDGASGSKPPKVVAANLDIHQERQGVPRKQAIVA